MFERRGFIFFDNEMREPRERVTGNKTKWNQNQSPVAMKNMRSSMPIEVPAKRRTRVAIFECSRT